MDGVLWKLSIIWNAENFRFYSDDFLWNVYEFFEIENVKPEF